MAITVNESHTSIAVSESVSTLLVSSSTDTVTVENTDTPTIVIAAAGVKGEKGDTGAITDLQPQLDTLDVHSGSYHGTGTNVVSSSAQTIANLPAGTVSGSAQIIDGLPAGTVSGSAQIVLDNADKTNFNTDDVAEGSSNLYYTDTRVKDKLNSEGVISASAQIVAGLPGGTVSGSAQIVLNDADKTGFDTDDVAEGSSNLYYTDTRVKDKLNADNVHSGSAIALTTITASGDISASGDITASGFSGDGSGLTGLTQAQITDLSHYTDADVKTKLNNDNVHSGSAIVLTTITASGDISSSATGTGSFGRIHATQVGIGTDEPGYALDVTGSLANEGDGGVVRFESKGGGDLIFNDGCQGSNETAIQFNENGRISGEGEKFNFSSNTKDVVFHTGSGITDISTPALTISGSNGNVGIGSTEPPEKLTVEGNISASGDLIVTEITASGNISSSGTIAANIAENSDTGYKTVMVDTATGILYRTGSYGGGGGGTGEWDGTRDGDAEITGSLIVSSSGQTRLTLEGGESTPAQLVVSGSIVQPRHTTGGQDFSYQGFAGNLDFTRQPDDQEAVAYPGAHAILKRDSVSSFAQTIYTSSIEWSGSAISGSAATTANISNAAPALVVSDALANAASSINGALSGGKVVFVFSGSNFDGFDFWPSLYAQPKVIRIDMTPYATPVGTISTENLIRLIASGSDQLPDLIDTSTKKTRRNRQYETEFGTNDGLSQMALSSFGKGEAIPRRPTFYHRWDIEMISDWEENTGYNPGSNGGFLATEEKWSYIQEKSDIRIPSAFYAPVTASILSSSQYIGLDGGTF